MTARRESPAAPDAGAPRARTRERVLRLWAPLGAVLAAGVALAFVVGDGPSGAAAGPSAAVTTSAPSTVPVPTDAAGPTEAPSGTPSPETPPSPPAAAETPVPAGGDEPPPLLPAVALEEPVAEGGLTGSLVRIEEIDADGNGPGNIDGPALRVTVRLVNGTASDLDLFGVAVALSHGAGNTPASPIEDASQSPFSGALPPGEAAEGVYVFGVPPESRSDVRVEVGARPGAPVMVFTGGVR